MPSNPLYHGLGDPRRPRVCAICLDRTVGEALEYRLTEGVTIWLCEDHHSDAYTHRNDGVDFVVTLAAIWVANCAFTRRRARSLQAHLRAVERAVRPAPRPRPGSHAWPQLRQEAEDAFARGDDVLATIDHLRERHLRYNESAPSVATMRRWAADRRWIGRPDQPGQQRLELAG